MGKLNWATFTPRISLDWPVMAFLMLVRFDSSEPPVDGKSEKTHIYGVNREETSLLTSLGCTVSKYSRMIFVQSFFRQVAFL